MADSLGFGVLFKNNRDRGPAYTGSLDVKVSEIPRLIAHLREAERVVQGDAEVVRFDLASKLKEAKNGNKFFSLWFSEPWKKDAEPKQQPRQEEDVPF